MADTLRLAVLISGGGTTLQNLLDRCADGRLPARVAVVVSSRADAFGLERARRAGVPAHVVERKGCASRAEFSQRILDHARAAGAGLVGMGGFLQLLEVPEDFRNKVMNVHPALLPAFGGKGYHGLNVHRGVLEAGGEGSGRTGRLADTEDGHRPIRLTPG